ncbi:hypothetical protein BGX20_006458 [Mortierella sp. AD010]|nr:hypothetical protein BGX20_006458 [Mortierella sp. AD010]
MQEISRAIEAPRYTQDIIDLLSAVGGQGKEGDNGRKSIDGGGLRSFRYGVSLHFDQQIVEALPLNLSASLTALDVKTFSIKLNDLAYFLGQFSKLDSLAATISMGGTPEWESESESFLQSSWACLGIKKLDLRIANMEQPYGRDKPDWKGSCKDRCMEHAFSQIGKLVQSEEWKPRSATALIDQKNGYLRHLAELKRLQGLDLMLCRRYLWLTPDDVKWMLGH